MINLSKAGICMKVTEAAVLKEKEKLTVEFSLPDIPEPMQLEGELVWSRSYRVAGNKNGMAHVIGVNFINITETCRGQIQSFILEAIHVKRQLRSLGIARLMSNIRKLPPATRLKSYDLLIRTGHAPLKR
jgi:hypothetical protein